MFPGGGFPGGVPLGGSDQNRRMGSATNPTNTDVQNFVRRAILNMAGSNMFIDPFQQRRLQTQQELLQAQALLQPHLPLEMPNSVLSAQLPVQTERVVAQAQQPSRPILSPASKKRVVQNPKKRPAKSDAERGPLQTHMLYPVYAPAPTAAAAASGVARRPSKKPKEAPHVRLAADIGLATIAYAAEQKLTGGTEKPKAKKGKGKHKDSATVKEEEEKEEEEEPSSPTPNQFEDAQEKVISNDVDSVPSPPPAKKRKSVRRSDEDIEEGEIVPECLEHDVLFGRGGSTNRHPGNILYRNLVKNQQLRYLEAHRLCKGEIAHQIVRTIRDRGGRFLKKKGDAFVDVGDTKARDKTSQALREGLSQRLFSQTAKEGQISLALLDDGSRDAISKLFRLGPKKRKSQASAEKRPIHPIDPNDESAIIPTDADVVYGKGKAIQDHPGNIRFRNIVNMHRMQYQSSLRKADKSKISNDICRIIKSSGGRFLQYEDGKYHEVKTFRAKEKVSHALRNRKQYANTYLAPRGSSPDTPAPLFGVLPAPAYPDAQEYEASQEYETLQDDEAQQEEEEEEEGEAPSLKTAV